MSEAEKWAVPECQLVESTNKGFDYICVVKNKCKFDVTNQQMVNNKYNF